MSLSGLPLVKEIVRLAGDHKASALTIIDLRSQPESPADFFVICTGDATTHVKAIADGVDTGLRQHPEKTRTLYSDGYEDCTWIALDYFDVILHVFLPDRRLYYSLDRLWATAQTYSGETIMALDQTAQNQISTTPRAPEKVLPPKKPVRRPAARKKSTGKKSAFKKSGLKSPGLKKAASPAKKRPGKK
jgi:ribosome-associated protein